MSASENLVIIMGNLGRDPEVRSFQSGGKVCNLRVATSERWKDRNTGEKRERTEWHSVAVYQEGGVRFLEQYAKKGTTVYIKGQLETRKWQDQSGQDRYTTEITVRPYKGEVKIVGNWAGDGEGGGGSGSYGGGQSDPSPAGQNAPPPTSNDLDDEIPF